MLIWRSPQGVVSVSFPSIAGCAGVQDKGAVLSSDFVANYSMGLWPGFGHRGGGEWAVSSHGLSLKARQDLAYS